MRIVVIADTHIRHFSELPKDLLPSLKRADAVFHLGDYHTMELLEELKQLKNFHGVSGNHDKGELLSVLPELDVIELKGKKIGLVHGHGCVFPLGFQYGLFQRFNGTKLDAILFGHTHIAVSKIIDGTLFFNPGSAAGRFPADQKSFGILDIDSEISSHVIPMKTVYRNNLVAQAYSIAQELSPRELYYRLTTLY
jgi:uncharacterized protein